MNDDDFGHFLKIRYGLPPNEPTTDQLRAIKADIAAFSQTKGREPTDTEVRDIVSRHCPEAGTYKYGADVHAELRRQIAMLAQAAASAKK